jgi:hypothetical protein
VVVGVFHGPQLKAGQGDNCDGRERRHEAGDQGDHAGDGAHEGQQPERQCHRQANGFGGVAAPCVLTLASF